MVAVVPVIVVFLIFQRHFVQGLTAGAVKDEPQALPARAVYGQGEPVVVEFAGWPGLLPCACCTWASASPSTASAGTG